MSLDVHCQAIFCSFHPEALCLANKCETFLILFIIDFINLFFSFSKIVKFHTEDPLSKSHLKYTVKGCKTYDAKYKRYGDLKEVTFEVSRTKQQ